MKRLNAKGFSVFEALLIVAVLTLIVAIGAYIYSSNDSKSESSTLEKQANGLADFTPTMEDFTISYPGDWTVEEAQGGFSIKSPDGIQVAYERRYIADQSNSTDQDKIGCGVQATCPLSTVRSIDKLDVANLGEVMLIKTDDDTLRLDAPDYLAGTAPRVYLHKPLSDDTTPVVGINQFDNYIIDFSLPSKDDDYRFRLYVTDGQSIKDRSTEEFFKKASVKQGIDILKSLRYEQ